MSLSPASSLDGRQKEVRQRERERLSIHEGHCGANSRKPFLFLHGLSSFTPQPSSQHPGFFLVPPHWRPSPLIGTVRHGIWPAFSSSSYSLGLQESSESSIRSPSHILHKETYTSCRRFVLCSKTGTLESGLCVLHKMATQTNCLTYVTKK